VTRATLSNLSDLSAIGGQKNIVRTKLLVTGFTALRRMVHPVIRPPDDEIELATAGTLT
jgi:hypothetical protein